MCFEKVLYKILWKISSFVKKKFYKTFQIRNVYKSKTRIKIDISMGCTGNSTGFIAP